MRNGEKELHDFSVADELELDTLPQRIKDLFAAKLAEAIDEAYLSGYSKDKEDRFDKGYDKGYREGRKDLTRELLIAKENDRGHPPGSPIPTPALPKDPGPPQGGTQRPPERR